LHYSVSESSEYLEIVILNKTREQCEVKVRTIDGDAKANEDYVPFDGIVKFSKGQEKSSIKVEIKDDDDWEPDEDFFVQLYEVSSNAELLGQDCRTRVTIIDDDKPGQVCFQDPSGVKVSPTDEFAEITIIRKNGSDGVVTVDYETVALGNREEVAQDGKHYVGVKDTLTFDNKETEKTIKVKLIP
jgi:solute carrier family 8 (sodium/calcium exchanger)